MLKINPVLMWPHSLYFLKELVKNTKTVMARSRQATWPSRRLKQQRKTGSPRRAPALLGMTFVVFLIRVASAQLPFKPLLLLLIILHFTNSYAGAWLPSAGEYKISSSILLIDGQTKKFQKEKAEMMLDVYRELNDLYSANQAQNAEQTLEELQAVRDDLDGFNDRFLVNSEIEYGVNALQSFGLKGNFSEEKILNYKYNHDFAKDHDFKRTIAKEVGFYYKHSLYKNDSWQISLVPEISYKKRAKQNKARIMDIGSYIGYSRISKSGKKSVSEFGFVIGKIFNDGYKNTIFRKISFFEGVELLKSLSINNYFEYSFTNNGNIIYNNTIYEQIGVSKEFAIGQNDQQKFTTQIGYYWKKSLVSSSFMVSGPVFSLWMSL